MSWKSKGASRLQAAGKSAVDAAALQEHLLSNLGDALKMPSMRKRPEKVPRPRKKTIAILSDRSKSGASRSQGTRHSKTPSFRSSQSTAAKPKTPADGRPSNIKLKKPPSIEGGKLVDTAYDLWQCESCSKLNPPSKLVCRLCSATRPAQFKEAAPVKLSLAQRRGLVPKPAKRLSAEGWDEVEQGAASRGMADQDCPICMDPLGLREHLITSCGHLFHTSCLLQFESFSRQPEGSRTCPVCRHAGYERRTSRLGVHPHRLAAVIALQAAWRGTRTRQTVSVLRRRFYLEGKGAPLARRKFFAEAVGRATSKLRVAVQRSQGRIDALMGELDRSADEARELMARALDAARGRRARQVASIEREFGVSLSLSTPGSARTGSSAADGAHLSAPLGQGTPEQSSDTHDNVAGRRRVSSREGERPGASGRSAGSGGVGEAMRFMGIDVSAKSLGLTSRSRAGDDRLSAEGALDTFDPGAGIAAGTFRGRRSASIAGSDRSRSGIETDGSVVARVLHDLSSGTGSKTFKAPPTSMASSRRMPWRYTTESGNVSAAEWTECLRLAAQRMVPDGREGGDAPVADCPVCLVALLGNSAIQDTSGHASAGSIEGGKGVDDAGTKEKATVGLVAKAAKPMVLLRCTHVFHQGCLQSYASFCSGRGLALSCPVCRSKSPPSRALDGPRLALAYSDVLAVR